MLDEESPEEPDHPYPEPDPEADLDDPVSELGPDPPSVGGSGSAEDVGSDLTRSFWGLVLLANAALFGLTVGPMALYFYPDPTLGGGLLAVGVLASVLAVRRYRDAARASGSSDDGRGGAGGSSTDEDVDPGSAAEYDQNDGSDDSLDPE